MPSWKVSRHQDQMRSSQPCQSVDVTYGTHVKRMQSEITALGLEDDQYSAVKDCWSNVTLVRRGMPSAGYCALQ